MEAKDVDRNVKAVAKLLHEHLPEDFGFFLGVVYTGGKKDAAIFLSDLSEQDAKRALMELIVQWGPQSVGELK